MLETIANASTYILIIICLFAALYYFGGEDIIFFRKKKYVEDPKGDKNLQKVLSKFANRRSYEVLPRTTLAFEGKSYTFDAILLGYFGTILITSNNRNGDIYIDANADIWVQVYDRQRFEFNNITEATNGSVRFIKDLYRAEKAKGGQVDTLTVFASRDVSLIAPKSIPLYTLESLVSQLDSTKYLADHNADIQQMKEAIAKYTI